jgi:hypothetical protein
MEHEEAIRLLAAQNYVAGKLPEADREAFESHFFDCPECAEEVRWEQIFRANLKSVRREETAQSLFPRWFGSWRIAFQWRPARLSLAANFALAVLLLCVLIVPPRRPTPAQWTPAQWTPPEYFAPGPTHGDEDVHVLPAGASVYLIRFSDAKLPSYSYEVTDSNGRRELSDSLPPQSGQGDMLRLAVLVGRLPNGLHTLVVRGQPGAEIVSRSRFQISR